MGPARRVALVTGGGSGIGRHTALALVKAGFSVIVTGRRWAALEETRELANDGRAHIAAVAADISLPVSVDQLFQEVRSRFGRLDVLFNNAGVTAPGVPLEDLSWEQWSNVVAVNLSGVFLCTQAAFRLMKQQEPRGGRIINNGSVSAYAPRPHSAAYTATKHAVTGLTKSTSLDGRRYNIACGQIDIGNAATTLTDQMQHGVPQADGSLAVEPTFDVQHVADAVVRMAELPLDVNVQFITIMATHMPLIGRG